MIRLLLNSCIAHARMLLRTFRSLLDHQASLRGTANLDPETLALDDSPQSRHNLLQKDSSPPRPSAASAGLELREVQSRGLRQEDSGGSDQSEVAAQCPGKRGHCIHGKYRSRCLLCGGGSICVHNKLRTRCMACGGNAICIHHVIKYSCKECRKKYGNTCPHGRTKAMCKECGGSAYCRHGKRKARCWECGGASLCVHKRQKDGCKECGGSSICVHGRVGSHCKECGGATICVHGKLRPNCKYCAKLCQHSKIPRFCAACGGSGLCGHGRNKSACIQCQATRICRHGRVRRGCEECDRRSRRLKSETAAPMPQAEAGGEWEASGPDPWTFIDQLTPEARMQIHHAIMLTPFTAASMRVEACTDYLQDGAAAVSHGSGSFAKPVGIVKKHKVNHNIC